MSKVLIVRKRMKRSLTVAALLFGALFGSHRAHAGDAKGVESFFKTHCLRCHDGKDKGNDFRLDTLKTNFADAEMAERWSEVLLRINSGEMPPKKEPRPTATEAAAAVEWIATEIKKGETARAAVRGPVTLYRLSRQEYANTVLDHAPFQASVVFRIGLAIRRKHADFVQLEPLV